MDYYSLISGGVGVGASLLAGRKTEKEAKRAQEAQALRIAKINKKYKRLAGMYQPTGTYGQAMFENLRKQKGIDIGRTAGHYLRSGIGGTSYADINEAYERGVGRTSRRTLEDYLTEKRSSIERERIGYLSGIETQGPSFSDIATAYSGVGTGLATIAQAFKPKEKKEMDYQTLLSALMIR